MNEITKALMTRYNVERNGEIVSVVLNELTIDEGRALARQQRHLAEVHLQHADALDAQLDRQQ